MDYFNFATNKRNTFVPTDIQNKRLIKVFEDKL